jgi:ribonuclease P protein component
MSFSFTKAEKICSKYDIDALFDEGRNFKSSFLGFKFLWQEISAWPRVKYLVVVPKRRVKKAVDRNRIKRQLREIIRLNKKPIENEVIKSNKRLLIAVIYNGPSKTDYAKLESAYLQMAENLPRQVNKF